jgi:carbamoyl-phosphate synthase large subunit
MLEQYMREAVEVSPEHPVLIDKFLDGATEVDVDALADGERVVVCAIMEHIEEAGIHSGDSACVIPARTLSGAVLNKIRENTKAIGLELKVKGLMNIQYAVKDEEVYVLEVNPRASRTVPYVSKTIGVPVAKLATRIMIGRTLAELGFAEEPRVHYYSVKEAVLPFAKFPGCNIVLGPEMRSTGEVMGIDVNYGLAYAKSQAASYGALPTEGTIFISINDADKPKFLPIAKRFRDMGFKLVATAGTAGYLAANGIENEKIFKLSEGRPNVVDYIINNKIQLVINTFFGKESKEDGKAIRSNTLARGVPLLTTMAAARAASEGIAALKASAYTIKPLQEYHAELRQKGGR